jgi:FkbM family methyltransferase
MLDRFKSLLFKLRYGFAGYPIKMNGVDFRVDESLRRWNFTSERAMQVAFDDIVSSGDQCIDVGANFGIHTLYLANLVGDSGKVWAFEPLPKNLDLLRWNIRLNHLSQRVEVVSKVASNSSEPFLRMAGMDDPVAVTACLSNETDSKTISVPNVRLDDMFNAKSCNIGLIKIDVEGAEMEVLRGAEEMLKRFKPNLVIEVHGFALPKFGSSVSELRGFLTGIGYSESIILQDEHPNGEYFQAVYRVAR